MFAEQIVVLFLSKRHMLKYLPAQQSTGNLADSTSSLAPSGKANLAIWSLVALGVFLRLFHYFDNRSLWIDEIYLCTSLVKMNLWELATQPLYYEQKAPLGFLWLERGAVMLLGKGEMALRLIPLLAGIASLFLFLPVTRRYLQPAGIVLAVGLLALAPPLVYHAVEAKQYATELFATILCLYLYLRYSTRLTWLAMLQWGLWGAFITWFSYSSIFVLAGIAGGVGLGYVLRKDWQALARVTLPFSLWVISFLVNYTLFARTEASSGWLVNWFELRDSFMPLPPTSPADAKWFLQTIYRVLDYPLGLLWQLAPDGTAVQSAVKLSLVLLTLGLSTLAVSRLLRKDFQLLLVLILPVIVTLVASGLKLYPFYERLTVFLAPLFILLIALGSERILTVFRVRPHFAYLLPILLLLWPLGTSLRQVMNTSLFGGYKNACYRESIVYLMNNYQKGDVIYVYWNMLPVYNYYKEVYNLRFPTIEGRDARFASRNSREYIANLQGDKAKIQGEKRTWFIYKPSFFTNIGNYEYQPTWYWKLRPDSGNFFYKYVARTGKEVQHYSTEEGRIVLLNLSAQ